MARKSRKDSIRAVNAGQALPKTAAQPVDSVKIYRTVGYARLSIMETRDRKDNEALQNQKALLREFIGKQPDLQLQAIYEDNGETGINFDRAGFESMMEAIRSGKADCIVVKDLSRFGRDYIEAGNYLEHIFPFMGVRFISISDGYDSADATTADCLIVALKNLMNHMYSKDISRKSGSVLREKMRRGEFIGAYAAYGYIKDPVDRHHIVIDPEAAAVVREIFQQKLAGLSNQSIARRLNEAGVPSPCCYRYQKGILLDKRFAADKPWVAGTIKGILKNQVYLGHMVQGRRRSEFYTGRPEQYLSKEDWTIVENTHEPIICQKDFDRVQAICEEANARYHSRLGKYDHLGKSENILKGLVYCSDCGKPMVRYKQVSHGKKIDYYYLCPNYAAYLEKSGCSYKFLREDILLDTLSQLIAREIEQTVDAVRLAKRLSTGAEGQTAARTVELQRLNTELARMESRKKAIMQDYLAGELARADYEELKRCCADEAEALKGRITVLREEQRRQTETLTKTNPWLQAFGNLRLPDRLDRELVHALVERITIYESSRIEVTFRFRDEKEQLLTAIEKEVVA